MTGQSVGYVVKPVISLINNLTGMILRECQVDSWNLQQLASRHHGEGHSETVELVARQVGVDGLQVGSILVLGLRQGVPDDVSDMLDKFPEVGWIGIIDKGFGQEIDVTIATDRRVKLDIQRLDQVPFHLRLQSKVGICDIFRLCTSGFIAFLLATENQTQFKTSNIRLLFMSHGFFLLFVIG